MGLLLLAAAAGAFVWLLRGAEIPGGRPTAAVVAGILAGLLMGPHVIGTLYPAAHETVFLGGADERRTVDSVRRERTAAVAAMIDQAAPPETLELAHAETDASLEAPIAAWNRAKRDRLDAFGLVGAALFVAIAILAVLARPARPLVYRTPVTVRHTRAALIAGICATLIPLLGVTLCAAFLVSPGPEAALAAGCASCAGAALWRPMRWTPRIGRSRLITVANASALTVSATVLLLLVIPLGSAIAIAAAAALALWIPAHWLAVPRLPAPRRRLIAETLFAVTIPTMIALGVCRLDLTHITQTGWSGAIYLILALALATDGRWLGTIGGLRLARVQLASKPMTLATEILASGPLLTQAILASLMLCVGLIDPATPSGSALLAGLWLGPIIAEPLLALYRGSGESFSDALG